MNQLIEKFKLSINPDIAQYHLLDSNSVNTDGQNALMFALQHNHKKNLGLSNIQWDYLIKNSNLLHTDNKNKNALSYVMEYYNEQKIKLSNRQWNYLFKNSNLCNVNKNSFNALMYVLVCNKSEGINCSKKQIDYLIDNCNMQYVTHLDMNVLMIAFLYLDDSKIILKNSQYQSIINKMDLTNSKNRKLLQTTLTYFIQYSDSIKDFPLFFNNFDNKDFLIKFIEKNNKNNIYNDILSSDCVTVFKERSYLDKKLLIIEKNKKLESKI